MNCSAIDLFCGIGGLTHGLELAGIDVQLGIDLDKSCQYAYEANNEAKFFHSDISSVEGNYINETFWNNTDIKILVGCAPCQPFSTHQNKNKNKKDHKKWNLLNEFERLITETNPDVISMENVPNLSNQVIFKEFVEFLKSSGYYVTYSNVYCPDYGLAQKRRRLVLLGSKKGYLTLLPPTHSVEEYTDVKSVIGFLPELDNGEIDSTDPLHRTTKLSPINLERIKQSKPNGTWEDWNEKLLLACHKRKSGQSYKSVYGRMSWSEPAPTITTQFYNYGTGRFGHPEQNRALTLREGAILQSFPKDYKIIDPGRPFSISKYGQHIGNAVPVKLGEIIGQSILSHIEEMNE